MTKKKMIALKTKHILNIMSYVFFILIVGFSVFTMLFVNPKNDQDLFGYRFYIVLSNSMNPEFEAGDIIITKKADAASLNIGDIITYQSIDPITYNEIITHQIVEMTYYQEKEAFVTKGLNNENNDVYPALEHLVIGTYMSKIPNAGFIIDFFKTPIGYLILIVVPFSILVSLEIRVLVKDYKKRKLDSFMKFEEEKNALLREIEMLKLQKTNESNKDNISQ